MAARYRLPYTGYMSRHNVCFVAFPGVQNLDLTGPFEIFSGASRSLTVKGSSEAYDLRICTVDGKPFRTSSGLQIVPDVAIGDVKAIDTLVVPGGMGVYRACGDATLVDWIADVAVGARVASVCTGAFLLASAGLLDGRRATTHWSQCGELKRRFPKVEVESDPIFVEDGIYTSAGVTAGLDLALALVEADHGPELALELARWFVMFVRRPGGQAQFSAQLSHQVAQRRPIAELQAWIGDHPDADLSVAQLAERAGMSPRNFARVFAKEVGSSPAAYVRGVRLETARRRLEQSTDTLDQIADQCGFGTTESLRRAFQQSVGVPPAAYRRHFKRA